MHSKEIKAIYLKTNNSAKIVHDLIDIEELFKTKPNSDNIFFGFESSYTPYQQLLIGSIPRIDLVILNKENGSCLSGLEVKLTALPDNSTCNLTEDQYGTELVIRPDTIVYLACSIAIHFSKKNIDNLKSIININGVKEIKDWTEHKNILPLLSDMKKSLKEILIQNPYFQEPLILQPIWKTVGKSPELTNNCLDIFVWSNFAFIKFILEITDGVIDKITRPVRTIVWTYKMLYDYVNNGQIDFKRTIDELSYNTKNDKAFAASGKVTHPFMQSKYLTTPRVCKNEIKNIILGGGQHLLSPERRFDAIIYNSPDLFT